MTKSKPVGAMLCVEVWPAAAELQGLRLGRGMMRLAPREEREGVPCLGLEMTVEVWEVRSGMQKHA